MLLSVWFFGVAELTTIWCTISSHERRGQLQSELRQGLGTVGTEQRRCRRGMKEEHAKAASFAWTEAAIQCGKYFSQRLSIKQFAVQRH